MSVCVPKDLAEPIWVLLFTEAFYRSMKGL